MAGIFVAVKLREKESYVPLDFFEKRYGSNKWIRLWAFISNVPRLLRDCMP
jgi:SSS family solute:Na+ symporter